MVLVLRYETVCCEVDCGRLVSFFISSRRRHTRSALVTGGQTCALPICGPCVDALLNHGPMPARTAAARPLSICFLSLMKFVFPGSPANRGEQFSSGR